MKALSVTRVFLPDTAEVRGLRSWLMEQMDDAAVPQEMHFRVQLCAEELFTNLLMHASWPQGPQPVEVTLACGQDGLRLFLLDRAQPFHPDRAPKQAACSSVDAAPVGGLGIKLVRDFSEHLLYASDACGNRTEVSFKPRDAGR